MLAQTRSRLSVELASSAPLCGMPFGKMSVDRNLERDREDVEAGEDVFGRRAARARNAAEIVRVQVDEVEDALLVELIRIVELAGDDPAAVGERVDVGVDESLIVETDFTAGGIAGVVALEGPEAVDEPVGLRAVVVRQDREIPAQRRYRIVVRRHRRGRSSGRRCA